MNYKIEITQYTPVYGFPVVCQDLYAETLEEAWAQLEGFGPFAQATLFRRVGQAYVPARWASLEQAGVGEGARQQGRREPHPEYAAMIDDWKTLVAEIGRQFRQTQRSLQDLAFQVLLERHPKAVSWWPMLVTDAEKAILV